MYRSISGISSQAFPRVYVCHGSAGVSWMVGVVGVIGDFGSASDSLCSRSDSLLLTGSVVSKASSGNTLVGLGASFSHGKIGAGF